MGWSETRCVWEAKPNSEALIFEERRSHGPTILEKAVPTGVARGGVRATQATRLKV